MKKYWDRKTWERTTGFWRKLLKGLRWLAILFFTALFFVGLVLALPWKVQAVLALIPVVGIFVPHGKQKYVWMALTVVLVGVYVWIHLPEEGTSAWGPYRFEASENREILTNPRNAAVHYRAIFEEYDDSIFTYPLADSREDLLTFNAPWQSVSHPRLSEWMQWFEEGMDGIIAAAGMDLCRFEKPADLRTFQQQKRRIKMMKTWSNILIRSANEDLGAGREARATEKMLAVLGMARHLYQQENLLDQASGFALEARAARALHRLVIEHAREEVAFERIASEYERIDTGWPRVWGPILQLEKMRVKNIVGMFYQVDVEGRTRISRHLGQGLHEALDYPAYSFLAYNRMSRLLAVLLWFGVPSNPEAAADLVDQRFDHYSERVQRGEQIGGIRRGTIWQGGLNLRSIIDWLAREQVNYYYPLRRQDLQHEALRRVTRILREIKQSYLRTGAWPASLDELIGPEPAGLYFDPVSELPFMYRISGEGFLLYSVGANGRDDGGTHAPGEGKDDTIFWPPLRSEETDADPASDDPIGGVIRSYREST